MRFPILILFTVSTLLFGQTKPNIAVMDMAGTGLSPSELTTLSNRLRTELFETEQFTVVEREQMETILKEQGFQQTGCTDAACAVEAGQLLNVDLIILGSIDRISRVFSINLRAVSVSDGKITKNVKSDLVDADVEDLMLLGMRKAARMLAGLDTLEVSATPAQLRGRRVVRYKGYKGGDAGSLTITVKPADAEVFVDDSSYGTGSMVIDYVPAGAHKVRADRTDYRRVREDAEIYRNQETALNLVLKPKILFSFSPGVDFFFKKTRINQNLVYQNDGQTKQIALDLDYTSSVPFSAFLSFGWEFGRNYLGCSWTGMGGIRKDKEYRNAQNDTFPFKAENYTYGGFIDYSCMVITIPGVLYAGPGFSLGMLLHKNGLHPKNAASATDTARYFLLSEDMIGAEYRFFGGPLICVKAGYKHVFITLTDRLLMGVKDNLLTASPFEPNNSASFVAANALGAGVQVRF